MRHKLILVFIMAAIVGGIAAYFVDAVNATATVFGF